jgi:hypothetical protein
MLTGGGHPKPWLLPVGGKKVSYLTHYARGQEFVRDLILESQDVADSICELGTHAHGL